MSLTSRRGNAESYSNMPSKSQAILIIAILSAGAVAGNFLITLEGAIPAFQTACNSSPIADKAAAEPAATDSPVVQACRENAAGAPIVKALQGHVGSVAIPWWAWALFGVGLLALALPGEFRPSLTCAVIGMGAVAASWYPPFAVAQELARLRLG